MDRLPHPWNTGFEWRDHHGAGTTITAEQAAQFDELGYFVLEDVFDTATLERLDAELQPGDRYAKQFLSGESAMQRGSAATRRKRVASIARLTAVAH
jgi:hypothetical protein